VAALRRGEARDWSDVWVSRLALDLEARVPEDYVAEESERVDLYWRLAQLETDEQVESFARSVAKRYGPLPPQLQRLLALVRLRALCQAAGIAEIVAGPKGAVLSARKPVKLDHATWAEIGRRLGPLKVKHDGRLVVRAAWQEPEARISGVTEFIELLATHPAQPAPKLARKRTTPRRDAKPGRRIC
jgi:transcription-repair coupling factor (superfamily II helicase)